MNISDEDLMKKLDQVEIHATHLYRNLLQEIRQIKADVSGQPIETFIRRPNTSHKHKQPIAEKLPTMFLPVGDLPELIKKVDSSKFWFLVNVNKTQRTPIELKGAKELEVKIFFEDREGFKGYRAAIIPISYDDNKVMSRLEEKIRFVALSSNQTYDKAFIAELYETAKQRLSIPIETGISQFMEEYGLVEMLVISSSE